MIAMLRREPKADRFLHVIVAAESCLISSVSFLETSMMLIGRSGDRTTWIELDALIARAGMQIVAQDTEQAIAARQAFLEYGKGRHPAGLNLGDCAAYGLAKSHNLPLLFKERNFLKTDLAAAD